MNVKVLSLREYRIKHAEFLEKEIKIYNQPDLETEILNRYLFYLKICGLKNNELVDFADYILIDIFNSEEITDKLKNAYNFFNIIHKIMQKGSFNSFPNKGEDIEYVNQKSPSTGFIKGKFLGFDLEQQKAIIETPEKENVSIIIENLWY